MNGRRFHQFVPSQTLRRSQIPEHDSYPIPESDLHIWTRDHFSELGFNAAVIGDRLGLEGKEPDLLCINESGAIGIVEFKRDTAEREVLAQVLEYNFIVSQILQSNARFNALKWEHKTIAQHYEETFKKDLPSQRPLRPFIAIVAQSFDRSFVDMIDHYNAFHNLEVTLLEYVAEPDEEGSSFTFKKVLVPDEASRQRNLPERLFVCRFDEAKRGEWNQCLERQEILLPTADVLALQTASKVAPVTLLVDVVRAGYVAVVKLEDHFPVYKAKDPNSLIIRAEWTHAVKRSQAVHRKGMFRASESLSPFTDFGTYQTVINRLRRSCSQKSATI